MMEMGPWSFDSNLIVMKELKKQEMTLNPWSCSRCIFGFEYMIYPQASSRLRWVWCLVTS
ncbi:hypothetical protein LINPERPRIM_LOCUS1945 [Linum perenne]